jgi:hypothetical protein
VKFGSFKGIDNDFTRIHAKGLPQPTSIDRYQSVSKSIESRIPCPDSYWLKIQGSVFYGPLKQALHGSSIAR